MKIPFKTMAFLIITVFSIACSKDDNPSSPTVKDVYACGYEYNGAGKTVAKYWKNGITTRLTDGAQNAKANSIKVVGNDIYVAGYESNGTIDIAKYWKNGVAVILPNGGSLSYHATDIEVVGSDVYVSGDWISFRAAFEVRMACYWKNEVLTTLTSVLNIGHSEAKSIAIDGSTIYVAGTEPSNTTGRKIAKYWKNGVSSNLSNGTFDAYVSDIIVHDNDVYVTGAEWNGSGNTAKYWKNGFPVLLGGASRTAWASAIKVIGNDVHVVGSEQTGTYLQAKYWKNGEGVNITDGTKAANAYDIAVSGSDNYIAGSEATSTTIPALKGKVWVNNTESILNEGAFVAEVVSICLVMN